MNLHSGAEVLNLLPWVPDGTYRVIIDIQVDDVVRVYIQQFLDSDKMTLKPLSELKPGDVVVTRSEDLGGEKPS